jgi:hypothetical protein
VTEPTASRVAALEQQVEQLSAALLTNRVTSTAVGLVMASQGLDRAGAFAWLVAESQLTNTKLSAVALALVVQAEEPGARHRDRPQMTGTHAGSGGENGHPLIGAVGPRPAV